MHIITELYQVDTCQSVLQENFKNNKRKWEIVDIDTETSAIKDGYYYMKNKSRSRWNYYKTKTNLKRNQDFIFEATLELEKEEDSFGHFGLVWGFDKNCENLNRFTLSADGQRALIMHFEKDHKNVFHRFQNRKLPKFNINKPVRFTIIKLGEYFHFLINKTNVYIAHESFFAACGNFAGYYIEPGLSIKSNYLEVKRIRAYPMEAMMGLQLLMNNNPIK